MTLMLSNDDAAKVLTMTDTVAALEALYMDLGNGSAIYRGRTDLFAPTNADIGIDVPAAHQFKTLDGSIPRLQAASVRVTSDVVAFPEMNGLRRLSKFRRQPAKPMSGSFSFLVPPLVSWSRSCKMGCFNASPSAQLMLSLPSISHAPTHRSSA